MRMVAGWVAAWVDSAVEVGMVVGVVVGSSVAVGWPEIGSSEHPAAIRHIVRSTEMVGLFGPTARLRSAT